MMHDETPEPPTPTRYELAFTASGEVSEGTAQEDKEED